MVRFYDRAFLKNKIEMEDETGDDAKPSQVFSKIKMDAPEHKTQIFVRKYLKTKHSILFQLNDNIIQI